MNHWLFTEIETLCNSLEQHPTETMLNADSLILMSGIQLLHL